MIRKNFELKRLIFIFAIIFLLFATALPAEDKIPLRIPKIEGSARLSLNGVLDDAIWQKALKLELNYETQPGENIAPPVKTEAFIAYSKTHLYVAFKAYDPKPSEIRGNFTDRDNIYNDDFVSINLDTFNDQRRIYTFACNPLGIQGDIIETDTVSDISWDAIWGSAGRIDANGYVVEMAIPFSSLRFQDKKDEQVWGFNLNRIYPRSLNHYIWLVPRDRNFSCILCQLAKITGFEGIKAGKNIEMDPSISGVFTREREEFLTGKWIEKKKEVNPGFTAHWGFTPNMVLSAAINPDFSQVEADIAQLDINTQYALYYPEKRPFFMEGANIFDTRVAVWKLYNPVHTRSLADPDWGIKLTGKQGPHTVGFFSVRDHITNLLIPGSQSSAVTTIAGKNTGSVLRYRLDVGKTSHLGLLVTDREGDQYYNRLGGADFYFRINRKKYVKAQFLTSRTSYPTETANEYNQPQGVINGALLDFVFRHESRDFGYYLTYRQASPGFRADLGYMPHVGYRNVEAVMIFASWRNPGHWYTFMNLTPSVEYETDFHNQLIQKRVRLTYNYQGPLQTGYFFAGNLGKKSYNGIIFDISRVENVFQIRPSGKLHFYTVFNFGNQIDFDNTRQGSNIIFNPGMVWKAGRHISIDLDHVMEWFKVDVGRLYTANVSNLKLVYQFNSRAFLRAILQYVNYNYNVDHYTFPLDTRFKSLFSQVLFSYKINPQTMLFLGYSDDHYGFGHIPLRQTNRTFFLKIGYALVI